MDCLVAPLQEKLEDWKKNVINLDKEHAKGNLKKVKSHKAVRILMALAITVYEKLYGLFTISSVRLFEICLKIHHEQAVHRCETLVSYVCLIKVTTSDLNNRLYDYTCVKL